MTTRRQSERDVERLCDELIDKLGGDVVRTNPPGRTKQHIGLPDRRYRLAGLAWYAELKSPDGKLSKAQAVFIRREIECHCLAICGGLDEVSTMAQLVVGGASHQELLDFCRECLRRWEAS